MSASTGVTRFRHDHFLNVRAYISVIAGEVGRDARIRKPLESRSDQISGGQSGRSRLERRLDTASIAGCGSAARNTTMAMKCEHGKSNVG